MLYKLPGGAENNTHLKKLDEKRRTAVAEKWQGYARTGYKICDYRHVKEGLYGQKRDKACADKEGLSVLTVQGYPVASENKQGKKHQYQCRSDKAHLLTDNGEDKIIMLLRKIEILLSAAAKAQTAESA